MAVSIRRFNEFGLKEFERMLGKFKAERNINDSELFDIVFNDNYSILCDEAKPIVLAADNSKYTIAKAIADSLQLQKNRELHKDKGLWTWLAALFLRKLIKESRHSPELNFSGDDSLYIYDPAYNRYYRHLVAFPCLVYSSLGDRGRIFLRGTIDERGEIVEQLSSVQDVQRNPGIIEAVTILYYDPSKDSVLKGAASKPNEEKNLGGQARRLREVLKQFAPTYDLNALNGAQIVELLPKEFDRWKNRRREDVKFQEMHSIK